ncbi:hypothetical protein I6A60_24785 [Frankia sp. AgB1.9]|uniref:hypothetical protein n=1 Tax=unclassified Frankia TaxID=2632575 RepID=UPI0019339472|nr:MULTISPECIES: hypothetical protein [unclassified Frankia]MBL7487425.1 hypothetical protein [Frankia sp. AgW1.1]MBL7551057.1 hypothetical protein [Frankia sp. AgB1.9]MBL7618838.1 hypothetical protein [Frankia sp. AgB1.8]
MTPQDLGAVDPATARPGTAAGEDWAGDRGALAADLGAVAEVLTDARLWLAHLADLPVDEFALADAWLETATTRLDQTRALLTTVLATCRNADLAPVGAGSQPSPAVADSSGRSEEASASAQLFAVVHLPDDTCTGAATVTVAFESARAASLYARRKQYSRHLVVPLFFDTTR